jgi:hypothetical protein
MLPQKLKGRVNIALEHDLAAKTNAASCRISLRTTDRIIGRFLQENSPARSEKISGDRGIVFRPHLGGIISEAIENIRRLSHGP